MRSIRLTLRGWVAVAAVVVGIANAVAYGPRALNAVVVPIAVDLVVGTTQVWCVSPPRTEHVTPGDGFPDETRTVSLDIDADRSLPVTVPDALSPGLNDDTVVDSVIGDNHINYEVAYRDRDPTTLGPATVVARDILDLLSKSFTVGGTTEVLALPRVQSLGAAVRQDLSAPTDTGRTNERTEFDRLREYVPGDPLRDIHWKSSAESGDLVVKAYDDRVTADAVRVSAGATGGHEDATAKAAVTLCCAFLDTGAPVHLISPTRVMGATPGDHRCVLVYLSWLCSGSVPDETAEVVVNGDAGKTCVALGGRETMFDRPHAERDAIGRSGRNPASHVETHQPDSGVSA